MGTTSKYIWVNGRLVEFDKATLHFLTAGLHYGIAVFEGIRCYDTDAGPALFRLDDHLDRLLASAHILGFRELPFSRPELAAAVRQTVEANGFAECYVRPLIYLAEGGWNLTIDGGKPQVGIAVWEWDAYLGDDARDRGVRANIASFTRLHPNVAMTKAKISGNYVSSVLAKTESLRLGFDEAIMLDPQGYVAECTGENLFLVKHGVVYTPPTGAVLEGITRDTIMALAGDLDLRIVEAPISRDHLYVADEVFVCGTAAEVIGLREIDFRTIGAGTTGPVTRELQRLYAAVVRGRHPKSEIWLDYVARRPIVSGAARGAGVPASGASESGVQGTPRLNTVRKARPAVATDGHFELIEAGYGHGV